MHLVYKNIKKTVNKWDKDEEREIELDFGKVKNKQIEVYIILTFEIICYFYKKI